MANDADPSPQYIETDERAAVLEMLAHVHEFSQLVVMLTGELGSGRSMLLHHLSEQLSVHYQTLSFSASDYSNLEDVQYSIALQLGCEAHPQEIEKSLFAMVEQNEHFHILVDDAHLLADEALTYLMAHSQGEHRWHLMLVGDHALHSMCLRVQENLQHEDMLHHVELQPMSEEATTQFLQGIYRQAGFDQLPLSDKSIHHYWRLSSGLPGQLIGIVDVQSQTQVKAATLSTKLPLGHIAAVVLIGSALLVSYLYQSPKEVTVEDDAIARLIAGEAVVTEVVEQEARTKSEANDPDLEVSPSLQSPTKVKSPDETPLTEPTPTAKQEVRSHASVDNVPENKQLIAEQTNKAQKTEHPLLSAKPTDYGLQLVGVRKKQSAQAVVDQFAPQLGENKLSIYTTQYKGQPWYVVVYAPIKGKDPAKQVAERLSKLMSTQPWVRPMEKIQEDIRKNSPLED